MKAAELALRYMEAFYAADLAGLRAILRDDLQFDGPFFRFNTAAAYLDSLAAAPPVEMSYEITRSYEDETSACLVYRLTKPGVETMLAQVFEVEEGKIRRIRLIFDSAAFS